MRILFVAMPNSIHVARWIHQLAPHGWDLHLFPAHEADPLPELAGITLHAFSRARGPGIDPSIRMAGAWPFRRGVSAVPRLLDRVFPGSMEPARRLARVVRRLRPDVIHSLEFQHAGYLTLAARAHLRGPFPPWIASNWGSDLSLFGRLADHVPRVRAVLAACDYYACECARDLALARALGLRGEALPVVPAAGGFDLEWIDRLRSPQPPSARRTILLKGYAGTLGRALVGLRAIERAADALRGYRVVVPLATPETALAAELVALSTGLPIELPPFGPYADALRRLGQVRASISLSLGDGIPTSLLEQMLFGSFPIQSNTGCSCEWVEHGATALLVHPDDPEDVEAALRRVLADDALVDRAAAINRRTVEERADARRIAPLVAEGYVRAAARAPGPVTGDPRRDAAAEAASGPTPT